MADASLPIHDGVSDAIEPDQPLELEHHSGVKSAHEHNILQEELQMEMNLGSDLHTDQVCDPGAPIDSCALIESRPFQAQHEIWSDIDEYFDSLYMTFPVLSYDRLISRFITEPDWLAVPDLRTLLLAIRLLNAAGRYRMGTTERSDLEDRIHQVEQSRLDHDFAENVSLDSVVCSLFLFTAYNVLSKHNRAFLYLDEAISLFEMVTLDRNIEEERKLRIEQVLFNTEAATHAIYAPASRMRRARVPIIQTERNVTGLAANFEFDRVASHLLRSLTQINLAQDARQPEEAEGDSEGDIEVLLGAGKQQHRYSCIQAADVVVTRQWRLSSRLVEQKLGALTGERPSQSLIERLGIAAMSWICPLRDGELRIVGLGKLAGLVQNICILGNQAACRYALAGLTSAIMREDHERTFMPSLNGIITVMTTSIPPSPGLLGPDQNDKGDDVQSDPPLEVVRYGQALDESLSSNASQLQYPSLGAEWSNDLNDANFDWFF